MNWTRPIDHVLTMLVSINRTAPRPFPVASSANAPAAGERVVATRVKRCRDDRRRLRPRFVYVISVERLGEWCSLAQLTSTYWSTQRARLAARGYAQASTLAFPGRASVRERVVFNQTYQDPPVSRVLGATKYKYL